MKYTTYLSFLIAGSLAGWPLTGLSDVVKPLDNSWDMLAIVTGLHAFRDDDAKLDVRLLEADGSATIAKNPIDLYLVVTNNSSAGDLQEHVWRLPIKVVAVSSVKLQRSGLVISARQETGTEPQEKRVVTISVTYHVTGSMVADQLEIKQQ